MSSMKLLIIFFLVIFRSSIIRMLSYTCELQVAIYLKICSSFKIAFILLLFDTKKKKRKKENYQ